MEATLGTAPPFLCTGALRRHEVWTLLGQCMLRAFKRETCRSTWQVALPGSYGGLD